jgi:ABC transport system ATP-binding/permease protein
MEQNRRLKEKSSMLAECIMLDRPRCIGKDPARVDLVVEEWMVSRVHCRAERLGDGFAVADLGSTNGTFLRGERLRPHIPARLAEEELFWVGATAFRCREMGLERASLPSGRVAMRSAIAPAAETADVTCGRRTMVVGKDPDRVDLALSDPLVSRVHCEVEISEDGYRLTDRESTNGTFARGERLEPHRPLLLQEGETFSVGETTLQCRHGEIGTPRTGVTLEVDGLTVYNDDATPRLHPISFTVPPGTSMAVVGTSGSGKSTLLKALVGLRPGDRGSIRLNGVDFYEHFATLKGSIGYAPQEDTVHRELDVESVLGYTARLRMPTATETNRQQEIDRVLGSLHMAEHRRKPINRLSGGMLKRVNVAMELLTRPGLLFMDEPTSGLDPGLEKEFMSVVREWTKSGCSVVVVTHSEVIVRECDLVLVLAPGGHRAYFGPTRPQNLEQTFGTSDFADICHQILSWTPPTPAVTAPPRRHHNTPGETGSHSVHNWREGLHQYKALLQRYWHGLKADASLLHLGGATIRLPVFIKLLLIQAVVIPLLLSYLFRTTSFSMLSIPVDPRSFDPAKAGLNAVLPAVLVLFLVVFACMFGILATANEITRERAILQRERLAGLQIDPYLASKITVWLVLCTVHSAALLSIVGLQVRELGPVWLMLLPTLAAGSVVAMLIGLLLSAAANSSYQAITLAGGVLFIMIIFSGIIPMPGGDLIGPLFRAVAMFCPSHWAFGALATQLGARNLSPDVSPQEALLWLGLQSLLYVVAIRIVLRQKEAQPA